MLLRLVFRLVLLLVALSCSPAARRGRAVYRSLPGQPGGLAAGGPLSHGPGPLASRLPGAVPPFSATGVRAHVNGKVRGPAAIV